MKQKAAQNDTSRDTRPNRRKHKLSPKSLSSYRMAASTYQNIILVRHPIVRLIFAYQDRVAGLKAYFKFYRAVARSLNISREDRSIQYSQNKSVKGSERSIAVTYWRKISVPTWPEFVQYLLNTKTSNDVSIRVQQQD